MCTLIGCGHWSRYFIYILISDLARFLKEDILGVGIYKQIIVDLRIVYHPVIILLIGFTSDFIVSMIMWLVINYREKKKAEKKNSNSFENEEQISKENSFDKILELKDSSNLNKPINNDNSLRDSYIFNRESSLKYYLIHNELATEEDLVSKSSRKFILISSGLIAFKEFVNAIIYSKDDTFNFYFLNLIIITIISKCFYKKNMYKHHILSIVLVSIVSFVCMVSFNLITIFDKYVREDETISINFENKYYFIIIFPLIYIIISACFCMGIIFQKNLMHSQFISSYKFLFYKGIFGICFCIITLIFSTNFSCEKPDLNNNNQKIFTEPPNENQKPFEPIKCRDIYENKTYLDNFISYFKNDDEELPNNITAEIFILIGYFILNFIANLSIIFVNKFLSPFHVLITECFYNLIHTLYQFIIIPTPNPMEKPKVDPNENNQKKYKGGLLYDEFFNNWQLRLVQFIAVFFEFIGYLIYMEIIQLNFCGFDRDISKNIQTRASLDAINSNKELDGDDDDITNNSFEMERRKK